MNKEPIQNNQKSEHDLKVAGATLGQMLNTSSYNENYERKKGMRFFLVVLIMVFVFSIIFLMIKPYSDIVVLYADDVNITIHEVKVTLFGGFRFKEDYIFEYIDENAKYGKLDGKAAQVAALIRTRDVDLVFADKEILLDLGKNGFSENHSHYTGSTNSEILLRHDQFENDFDLLYGLKIPNLDFITFIGESDLAITDNLDSRHHSPKERTQLTRFIDNLYEGKDYTGGNN